MDFNYFMPIEKIDEEKRMVWGYASTPTKDTQGEVVTLEAIKAALPDYMSWANIREMHTSSAVGVTKEAHVDGNGLYIGAKVVDEPAWQKCREGVYKGFSIGGKKLQKVGDTIEALQLMEISLVDRPANPDCRIEVIKVASAQPSEPASNPYTAAFTKLLDLGKDLLGLAKADPPAATDGFSLPGGKAKGTNAQTDPFLPNVINHPANYTDPIEAAQNNGTALQQENNQLEQDKVKDGDESQTEDQNSAIQAKLDAIAGTVSKKAFTEKERKHLAESGKALPDGSFPIESVDDLQNAVQAVGRASDYEKAKAHIVARAKALGATDHLPADWPGSTKQEKSIMNENLLKRYSEGHKAALRKVKQHLDKAIALHGKCMQDVAKCAGMAKAGSNPIAEHLISLHDNLTKMADAHDIASANLGKVNSSWVGEKAQTPKNTEDGDVSDSNDDAVDLLPQTSMTEGDVEGTGIFATDSPYSASAMVGEVRKAVAAALAPVQAKLAEVTSENAFMKGQMAILERMPMSSNRPRLFSSLEKGDISSILGSDPKDNVNAEIAKAYQGIDPNDPDSATRAASRILGLRVQAPGQFGKRITDPDFKGGAGR